MAGHDGSPAHALSWPQSSCFLTLLHGSESFIYGLRHVLTPITVSSLKLMPTSVDAVGALSPHLQRLVQDLQAKISNGTLTASQVRHSGASRLLLTFLAQPVQQLLWLSYKLDENPPICRLDSFRTHSELTQSNLQMSGF